MLVWRLCRAKWAASAFSGFGASEHPGSWNSQGVRAVYCGESRALCALELLAHVARKRSLSKVSFVAVPAEIPEDLIYRPRNFELGWNVVPQGSVSQKLGDRWLRSHAVVVVPSVVVEGESVILFNPVHPRFAEVKLGAPVCRTLAGSLQA